MVGLDSRLDFDVREDLGNLDGEVMVDEVVSVDS